METNQKFSWRLVWYSVLIWLLAIIVGSLVVLPWFYLVLPLVVFWTTVYYFKNIERTFATGLRVSLFWFLAISILSILEIVGPYYSNVSFYFSNERNWFLYPLILLIPVIYSLILENNGRKKTKRSRSRRLRDEFPLEPKQAQT